MAEQRRLPFASRLAGNTLLRTLRALLPAAAALLLWQGEAMATHAMGGELTYECLGNDQYRVRLNFYRDCNGVAAPSTCNNGRRFRVRSAQCGADFTACFGLDNVEVVTPICLSAVDRCTSPAGQFGIERYRYSAVINLGTWANCGTDWIIDWDLCCRNNAITSLNDPGSRNLYLYATLNNTLQNCNNSPRYLNDPTPFACVGQQVSYNHGFNDIDGDSLSFVLTNALGSNGSLIPYNNPYTPQQPVLTSGGANAVQINPVTGTISFVPSVQQFAVVTVLVTEWRNGVQIGQYLRDVQFAIIACTNSNPEITGINGTGQFSTTVCAGEPITFTVPSTDPDGGQTVTMTWNNGIPSATFNVGPGPLPVGTFSWTPTAANIGQNLFSVTVQDDACALNGVNNYGFTIQVTPPFTPANAGPDQNVCGFSTTLQGVLPFTQTPGQWTVLNGTGTFGNPGSPTSAVSGLSPGANAFQWSVNYGTCGIANDQVIINAFDPTQAAANAGANQMLCTPNDSTTMQGNQPIAPAVGTWTLLSGGGNIVNPNDPNSLVTNLPIGQNTFRWTIDNGPCGAPTSNNMTIMVYNYALPAANAGPDQSICGPAGTVTMNAQPANGNWSVVSGTGVFANPSNRNTSVSGLSIGANVFRWTINNGPCDPPATQDVITVFVFDPNSPAANAGADQQVCSGATTLAGNSPIFPAAGQWTVVSGTGTFAAPTSPTTTVSGLSPGANVFQWTLNNGPCANGLTTDQVVITRFDPNTPAANAGPDQDLCTIAGQTTANATLAGSAPTAPATGTWVLVSGTGTITNPATPNSTVTGMPVGLHVFQWTINNGPCIPGVTSDQVTIRVFDRNAAVANAGPDQEFCAPVTDVTLAANAAVFPATGQWVVVSGMGTFANAASPTTTVSGMAIGNNVYRWTLNNGPCPGAVTSDDVMVRLFDPATPDAAAGADQQLCGTGSTTLAATPVAFPAQGTWTLVGGTGTIVNPSSATSAVTGIAVGESVFQWSVSNGPCGGSSDQVTIQRFDPNNPVANAGPDQSICLPVAPDFVFMAGSTVTFPAVGTWTQLSGPNTAVIADAISPTTNIGGLVPGTYVLQWAVSNGPCPNGNTLDLVSVLVYDAGTPAANAGPDQQLCGTSVTTTMAGSALGGPATGQWVLVSGTGTITQPGNPSTEVTGLGVGQNIFQWTVDNGPCGTTTDQMSIFVFDPNNPVAAAGPNQQLCTTISNTITLNGSPVIFPATGLWEVSGGPATIVSPNSSTTLVTGLAAGTYQFTWTVDNGVCPNAITASTQITIVADGNAQPADAGPDQSVCGTANTLTMAANAADAPANGFWTVVQGTADFADASAANTTVSGLSIGINILQWNIDNLECGLTTDQVSVFVFDPNQAPANAGADQQLCTPTTTASTVLNGNAVTVPAVGQWTLVSGSGTIANPGSPNSVVSGLALGSNVFQWQINNGVCPSPITTNQVTIFVYAETADPANAGPDQQICTPQSSVNMAANATVGAGQGLWTLVNGGGTIVAANSPNTAITGLPVGANVFQWSIDNGPCGTSTDLVSILVFDENNPVANAGPDQQLCTPDDATTLSGSVLIAPATGQWTLVSGTGSFADASNPNTAVSGLTVGANVFEWTVSNGPCANGLTTDQVTIFVFDEDNAVADAGPDQEFCTPTSSATLNGSPLTFPTTGQWTIVSGNGNITDPNSPNTTITGLTVGAVVCAWTVSNGPCANGVTTDQVTIFIFDDNNPVADAGADQELCTPDLSTTMAGSAVIFPASGEWTLVSGSGNIADPSDPNTAITGLEVGENIFQWTVSNGPCANGITTDQVSIFVFDENNPVANAGADQDLCTPNNITTLFGSAVTSPATGQWTLVSGQGIITSANAPTTTVTGLGVGENVFEWTVSNGPCDNGVTSDQVSIFLFDAGNTAPNAGPDQELCTPDVAGTTMAGSPVTFPAVGTWILVSGTGTIVSPNDPNTAITGMPIGQHVFVWSVDNGPCETGAGESFVTISVFDENNPDANAGPDQLLCTPNLTNTTLAGSALTFPATGQWTIVSGSGTIANPFDPNTAVFDLGIGETVMEWTVSNGPCANAITNDQVTIQVFDANNPVASAGPDQDLCTPVTTAQLAASAVTFPSVGTWTLLSGTGTITDINDPNTTITGLGVGVIELAWTVSNGPCPNGVTSDQLTITLYDENNPLANAGPDQELCTPTGTTTSTNMQGSSVIFPAVGTWTLVSGSGTIANVNDPNTAVSGLPVGEHIFLWTVTNGPCDDPITSDLVSILVFDENNPVANAGPDQQVCTPLTSATLAGSAVTFPAQGTWTVVSGTGVFDDPNDPNTTVTAISIGTNAFQWEVYNGAACTNSLTSDVVTITLFDADAPPADAGPDQELCFPDEEVTLTGNAPVGAATGIWTLVNGAGTIAEPSSTNTNVTGLEVGINTFAWTLEGGDCVTTTDQVNILVFDPNNLDAFAGLDQALCTPQDSVFMAGSVLIVPATGTWTLVSGAGSIVDPSDPGTMIMDLGIGTNVFQWEVYNGPCLNSLTADQVSITLYSDTTAAANAGPDLETCVPINSIQLQGETPPLPAVGTWTVIAGNGTFSNVNDPQATVNDLVQGVNTFVWTLEWDPCPNNGVLSDTVNVLVYDPFAPVSDAGPDQALCTPDIETNLQGNTPDIPGVGTWTVSIGNATVVDPNDPNSAVTGLEVGVHEFVWTIYNGQCGFGPPSQDTVRIAVYDGDAPDAATGEDISLCTPVSDVQLEANDPVFPATGAWTSTTGTASFADANDPNTTVSGLGVGVHTLTWTIDNGACGITEDQVVVSIYDDSAPDANAGPDKELCTPSTSTTMAGNAPVFPGTGLWTVVSGSGAFADATDPTTTVSGLAVGANVFAWTIDNGPCGTTTAEVTVLLFDGDQAVSNAGPDQELCTPTGSTTLQGNAVTFPSTGTWVFVSGNGTLSDPNNPNATLSGLGVGQVVLQWVVDNGPCEPGITIDEVTINVFDSNAQDAAAGPDQSYCTPIDEAVSMFASSPVFPATGQWTLVNGMADIANPADPFTAITNLGLGQNTFQWTIDNGACGSTSDIMSIFVYDHMVPAADAGPPQMFCEDITTTELDAAPATSTALGVWSLIAGAGSISEPGNPNTFVSGLQPGNNHFVWTVDNGTCGTTTDTMLVYLKDCLTIIIPNAFSPNGDGVNDNFVVVNIESYPRNRMQIFNRWGNKVVDRAPYVSDWDGTSQFGAAFGDKLPESTYYYVLDLGDGSDAYTGFIFLRR